MRIDLVIICWLLCAGGILRAQSFEQDFQKIADRMDQAKSVSLVTSTVVKTAENGGELYRVTSELLYRKGVGTYTKLDKQEAFRTNEYEVLVHHDRKMVLIQKHKNEDDYTFSDKTIKDLKAYIDKELKKSNGTETSIQLVSQQGEIRTYLIQSGKGTKTEITLNMSTLKIVRVKCWFKGESDAESYFYQIKYDRFEYDREISDPRMLITYYFSLDSSGNYKLSPRYTTYKIATE